MPPKAAITPTRAIAPKPVGIAISSTTELIEFANMIYRAGPPEGHNKPESIAYAIAFGLELGIRPAVALSLIKVVKGKPSADGEAALSLIKSSPLCESLEHGVTGDGDQRLGWIETKRRDETAVRRTTFSVADAKRAMTFRGKDEVPLWGSSAIWRGYPDRMLVWRAIGHHAKDWWADVMCGLAVIDDGADRVQEAEVVSVRTVPTAQSVQSTDGRVAEVQASVQSAATPVNALPDKPTDKPAGPSPITDDQKNRFAQYRLDFLKARGVDIADAHATKAAWTDFLATWGVKSAIDMTTDQANAALAIIYDTCHTPEQKAMFGAGNAAGGSQGNFSTGLPGQAGGRA